MTGQFSTDLGAAAPQALTAGAILRVRPFTILYVNATVVFLGVMAQGVARGWLAYRLTGSNAALGGVLLAFGVAMLLATPWGGVIADRLPKRLVLQVSVALLAASSAWIGLAVALEFIEYWMLLGAGIVQAVAFALFNPARMALLAEILPRTALPRAISLLLVNGEVSRVIGPAVSGALVGAVSFGIEAVFLASAVLAATGVVLMAGLPPGRRSAEVIARSPWEDLVDGFRYVRHRADLGSLLWCGMGVVTVGLPYMALLPAVSDELFGLGAAGYGIMSAVSAAGAVLTGLLLGRRSSRGSGTRDFVFSAVVFGIGVGLLAVVPTFWVAVVVLAGVGGAQLAFQTVNQSLLLALSDMAYHGRIQGLVMMSFGAFGVAALPLGILADAVGLHWTLGGMGIGVLLVVAVFVLVGRRRLARVERLHDLG